MNSDSTLFIALSGWDTTQSAQMKGFCVCIALIHLDLDILQF